MQQGGLLKLNLISIQGFRSIERLDDLPIGKPTLLTGHNDAGKSATLDAIRFLLNAYPARERDMTYIASGRGDEAGEPSEAERVPRTSVQGIFTLNEEEQNTWDLPPEVTLRRFFEAGGSASYELLEDIPTDPRLRSLHALKVDELKGRITELGLTAPSQNKSALLEVLNSAAEAAEKESAWVPADPKFVKALPRVMSFDQAGQSDAEQTIKTALQAAYEAHAASTELKGRVQDLEDELQEKLIKDAAQIRQHIIDRCNDIGEVTIVPDVSFTSGLKATQVAVTARKGEDVRLGEAGAGRARRVALAVWEYTRGLLSGPDAGDVVLLYDEPDTHLDYAHQRDLMRLFRNQCAMPNVQMVITTHSMNLIDGVDISDVVHVKHEAHRTVVDRLVDESEVGRHLGAIAASLGLRNTVLLHERLFVGVEGVSEQEAFPVLFRLAMGMHLESCGIALWACRNNEGATDFAKFLVEHGRNVVFVIDRDSQDTKALKEARLASKGLEPKKNALYIGNPREFEDVFSDSQWASVANFKWPRNDKRLWDEGDIQQHRTSKKFSDALLSMFKLASLSGPTRKQQLTYEMAMSLKDSSEVPEDLVTIFERLTLRAAQP